MATCRLAFGLALAVGLTACGWTHRAVSDETPSASSGGAESPGRYDVPTGGVKELLAFVKDVQAFKPTTPEDIKERRQKAYRAVESALEKIARIATDEDKKLEGFDDAVGLWLVFRTAVFGEGSRAGSPEEKQKLIDDITGALNASPRPSRHVVSAASKVAAALEYGDQPKLAIAVCRQFGGILVKSADPEASAVGATMEGKARRLELVGKPLELSGTLVGGEKLDWGKYRGKVVLVEFWATWCTPCLVELANVRKHFEKYQPRGFEVIGISLDEDREALERFLKQQPFPWATLHDGGADNPLAARYGITGASAAILVDTRGRVVSINARGGELSERLASLLGPADAGGQAKEAADSRQK